MKNPVSKAVKTAAGILFLAALPGAAQVAITPSQDVPVPRSQSKQMRKIALRNVKPSVMAWWLDPQNNPRPGNAAPLPLAPPVQIAVPEGIDRIVAIDAQGALLVFGTDEAVRELRDTIAFLDRPQRQTEIEGRIISIPTSEMTRFWADLSMLSGQNPPMPLTMSRAEENALGDLFLRFKARTEATRSAQAGEGATQTLDFGPPVPLRAPDEGLFEDSFVVSPPLGFNEEFIWPRSSRPKAARPPFDRFRLQITPSPPQQNGDIALKISEYRGFNGKPVLFSATVRDGETLALALPASTPETRSFLLVTARLFRRAEPLPLPSIPIAPNLRELPGLGELFRAPTPQKAPAPR